MSKYECCGAKYPDGGALTDHMRSVHSVERFSVSLSCCGTDFAESSELGKHMKAKHGITMDVQT